MREEGASAGVQQNPNTVGLVLEGVSGSGKSTLLAALPRSEGYMKRGYASSVVLSEHHTQRVLEPKQAAQGLDLGDNLALLRRHVTTIRSLDRALRGTGWARRGRSKHRISYLLERFHLTHACHYDHVGWEDVGPIDEEMATLGCKLCVLSVREDEMEERLANLRRNPAWDAYLSSVGSDDREIAGHYARQQERFLELLEVSSMTSTVVDTSSRSVDEAVAEVCAFWLG